MYILDKKVPFSVKLTREGVQWAIKNGIELDENNCIVCSVEDLIKIGNNSNLIEKDIFITEEDFNTYGKHTTKDIYDLDNGAKVTHDLKFKDMINETMLKLELKFLRNNIEFEFEKMKKIEQKLSMMEQNKEEKNNQK